MGDEVPIKLGFKDVIFVMEDVDAASKVVQRRAAKTLWGEALAHAQEGRRVGEERALGALAEEAGLRGQRGMGGGEGEGWGEVLQGEGGGQGEAAGSGDGPAGRSRS